MAGAGPLRLGGIAGDAAALTGCSRTVSSASSLQWLLDNAPHGSTLCLTADIRSSTPITVRRSNITIDGRGHALKGVGYHIVLHLSCASNVTVRRLQVAGSNPRPGVYTPSYEHGHAVAISGGHSILLDYVRTWNVQGDNFYVTSCGSAWADGVTIRNSLAAWNSRQGFTVVAGRNVTVENMTFKNIAFRAIDIEPDWNAKHVQGATDIRFNGGTSYGWIGRFLDGSTGTAAVYIGTPYGAQSGKYAPVVARIAINGLRVIDAKYGIWSEIDTNGGYRVSDISFTNNRGAKGQWWTASRGVITCREVDGFAVHDNSQPVTAGQGMYMARNTNCTGAAASGNVGDGLAGQLRN